VPNNSQEDACISTLLSATYISAIASDITTLPVIGSNIFSKK
jgi:hypothetical protein